MTFDPRSAHRTQSSSPRTCVHIYVSTLDSSNQLPMKVSKRELRPIPFLLPLSRSQQRQPHSGSCSKEQDITSGLLSLSTFISRPCWLPSRLGHHPSQHLASLGLLRMAGRLAPGSEKCLAGPALGTTAPSSPLLRCHPHFLSPLICTFSAEHMVAPHLTYTTCMLIVS